MSRFVGLLFLLLFPLQLQAELQLQATGSAYYRGVIKVYNASLYTEANTQADKILTNETSRCLKLNYVVTLSKDKFIKAANVVLKRQNTEEQLAAIQENLEHLHNAYQDVKKGDQYDMCYQADGRITSLALNGKVLTSLPESANFANVYMGIWLAEKKPISKKLRKTLLSNLK